MAAGNITSNVIVPQVLAESNYEEWSICMKNYLIAHDLWDVVEDSSDVNPMDKAAAGWRKKNAAVLHAFQISCAPTIFAHIKGVNSAKVAWGKLAERYEFNQKWQLLRKGKPSEELSEIIQWFQGTTPGASDCIDRPTYMDAFTSVVSTQSDCSRIMQFMENHPTAKTARFLRKGFPILNMATLSKNLTKVQRLMEEMSQEELETTTDHEGNTALAIAAVLSSKEIAECLIRKSQKLLTIPDKNRMIPVVKASYYRYNEMTQFLYRKTPFEFLAPENGDHGSLLLHFCILDKTLLDIAWDLLHHYPRLAFTKFEVNNQESTPVITLSTQPSLFHSGSEPSFLQRWIYSRIKVEPVPICRNYPLQIEQDNVKIQEPPRKQHGLSSILQKLSGMKHIYEQKLIHKRAAEILRRISDELSRLNAEELVESGAIPAFFQAVQLGITEFLYIMCTTNPDLLASADENARDLFMHAIEYRQGKVFGNEDFSGERISLNAYRDKDNNNILHMAAKLAPDTCLSRISGAALKMQRELQWFKEVELLVPECKEFVNQNGETPRQVFSRDHKQLLKEGEEWMKQAAQSYTVVGALIITIMFAAAFTIPGGSKSDTGLPVFLHERLFMVFILSDAVSLFSACTSVLMFLGILTSRYAEEDFLKSLPTKLILGICTLLISIAAMMVAFCAAVSIMLRGLWWVIVLLILFASIPVIAFLFLQCRFLIEIFISTYVRRIFHRQRFSMREMIISIRERIASVGRKFARKMMRRRRMKLRRRMIPGNRSDVIESSDVPPSFDEEAAAN